MSRSFRLSLALVAALVIPGVSGAATAQPASTRPMPIRISGSSTVYPIVLTGIGAFRQTAAGKGVSISLKETGSTAGFRDLCSGRVEISNASRPINTSELKACAAKGIRFIEVPLAFDALSVVVHPGNTWANAISTQQLSLLWNRNAQGRINRWIQVNTAWPSRPIKLCGAGSDSGTFDYFNKAINGDENNSRRDYTASEDDNVVVNCVASNPQALGYLGYGWFRSNRDRLKALAVVNPKGKPVLPSNQAVLGGQYQPLSRPLFIYVNDQALRERSEVRSFTTFLIRNAPRLVAKANYIPLPDSTIRLVETKLYRHVLGTSFGGDLPVGLTISEALRRSFDQHKRPEFR
ncbi:MULTISPECIES: PstS family phosphate ABC transporter substrate-binding protein [unclassified Synechococcus]|uniref:PstS family phosphate ABC transporter substrate-binding protein n=1 Tax=unclassified Synechococcus TaxID=2626047 RepID=UPI001E61F661|nr:MULTISPECIES: PstS family phosphate ABC transporter substrate-binding protein [unclassified Synechococcus]